MDNLIITATRATDQIGRILNNVLLLVYRIFMVNNDGYMRQLINTIMNNNYLLVGVSLLICGFVIGILSRLIRV